MKDTLPKVRKTKLDIDVLIKEAVADNNTNIAVALYNALAAMAKVEIMLMTKNLTPKQLQELGIDMSMVERMS